MALIGTKRPNILENFDRIIYENEVLERKSIPRTKRKSIMIRDSNGWAICAPFAVVSTESSRVAGVRWYLDDT